MFYFYFSTSVTFLRSGIQGFRKCDFYDKILFFKGHSSGYFSFLWLHRNEHFFQEAVTGASFIMIDKQLKTLSRDTQIR